MQRSNSTSTTVASRALADWSEHGESMQWHNRHGNFLLLVLWLMEVHGWRGQPDNWVNGTVADVSQEGF